MASTEDVARLILEAESKGFAEAQAKIDGTRNDLDKLTADYKSGAIGIDDYMAEGAKLQGQLDDLTRAYKTAGNALKTYGTTQKAVAALSAESTSANRGATQAMLEFSRGVEDFSTGGFLGVLNNIPGTFRGIGQAIGISGTALAGWTAGISLAATGAYVLYKNWDTVAELFTTRNPIPEAATALDRYDGELKKVNESLDEMKKRTSLNYDELKKFNELTEEQRELEAKVAQERLTEANRKAHNENANQADKERASGFGKAVDEAGGFAKLIERFTDAEMERDKAKPEQRQYIMRAWEEVFNRALKGNAGAIKTAEVFAQDDKTGRTGLFDKDIERFSPAAKHAKEVAEEFDKEADEAVDEMLKAAKEAAKAQKKIDDARVDELNKQGKEGEKAALKGLADAKREKAEQQAETVKGANAVGKENAATAKGLTGIQAQAEALIAHNAAAGNVQLDAEGKLSGRDFQQLVNVISAELKRQNPRANKFEAASVAQRIAANAEQGVSGKVLAQQGMGLTNQQKLIGIASSLDAEIARQQQVIAMQGQAIANLQRKGQARSRTGLKRN